MIHLDVKLISLVFSEKGPLPNNVVQACEELWQKLKDIVWNVEM
jgi:hypothetical protein